MVVRSKAWTVFARSDAGIVGRNPIRGFHVCVGLFCVSWVQEVALRHADPRPRGPTDCEDDQGTEKAASAHQRAEEP
jgi:hypothetical protein